MNISRKTIVSSMWFALEVVGIFVVIQFIRFIIGNLDAFYSGLSLILIASALFLTAYLVARRKDLRSSKPNTKTFTKLLG
jgi:hypothetical protein